MGDCKRLCWIITAAIVGGLAIGAAIGIVAYIKADVVPVTPQWTSRIDKLVLTEQPAAVVVGAGLSITPTGTYQVITSTAWVTTSTVTPIISATLDGTMLVLRNGNAANNITIDGTGGNVECTSDVVLATGSHLMLIWNGSDWRCFYDND